MAEFIFIIESRYQQLVQVTLEYTMHILIKQDPKLLFSHKHRVCIGGSE